MKKYINESTQIQSKLTPREFDCLELLSQGFTTAQVSADLAIRPSTLNKHLASVRKKLGVANTTQALLKYQCSKTAQINNYSSVLEKSMDSASEDVNVNNLVNQISEYATFCEAFDFLATHLTDLGYPYLIAGMVVEPFGQLSNGAKLLGSSFPDDMMNLYELAGGVRVDPVPSLISTQRKSVLVNQHKLLNLHTEKMPSLYRSMTSAMLDLGASYLNVVPTYDHATDSPFCLTVSVSKCNEKDVIKNLDRATHDVSAIVKIFWSVIRKNRLLCAKSGLSRKEREILKYISRGYTSHEVAESMNMSLRGVERSLGQSRIKLGAKTTTSAIYRSIVLGAL